MKRALVALLALAAALPLPRAATAIDCSAPPPYTPSQATYTVLEEPRRYVTLPDGVTKIQVDVYRPDAAGEFPAVVWFDVYYKDDPNAVVNDERDYFVTRGYVFVHASSPGSNTSGGTYDNAFGPLEQQAATAVVEWAGTQSWSTGDVGMDGLSYAAIIQYFVGARRPPHLRALYPTSAYTDLYRDIVYVGGNLQAGYPIVWDVNNRTFAYLPPTRMGPEPATDAGNYALNLARWRPIVGDFLLHPHDDAFYEARSPRWTNDQIDVPFAIDLGWYDDMVYGGPINYETVGSAAKRLVIGPWGHSEAHRRTGARFERLRWYDRYLKNLPSGVECDPPVRVFVPEGGRAGAQAGHGTWRTENEWPIARTVYTDLHLGPGESLSAAPQQENGSASYRYLPERSQLWEGVVFKTPPLAADLEVTGYPELVLYASTQQPDTSFTIFLEDEAPDGTRTRLQVGWLRAASRAIDPARSQPGRPFHTFAADEPVPAGAILEYRIAIWPTSNLFKAGHRIRIAVNDAAIGPGGASAFLPPYPGTNTVHWGPAAPSRLVIPVVPPKA